VIILLALMLGVLQIRQPGPHGSKAATKKSSLGIPAMEKGTDKMSALANPVPKLPIVVSQLREVLDLLDDDAVVDLEIDGRLGYIHRIDMREDRNENFRLVLIGTEE
jgi:hypothetical protein